MNKKNILQNLLRRALTPAGTNMTRWTMALTVVMISLLAPTTVAWADGEEPQQSKPTYQLTSGDGIVHFFLKEGYKSTEVTKASEGATIVVSPDFDMIPAGKYATGEYTSDQVMVTPALDEDTGMPNNTSDGQFTMPAMAVTVSAVLAPQEEYTIYLTTATPQTIPESMWILFNSLEQYYVQGDKNYEFFLDLNLDGKRDVLLTEDYNEATGVSTYSVVRQAGADDIEEDLRLPLTYVHNLQYNSVLFKLSKTAVQSGWITVADGTATGTALVYNGQAQTPAVIVKDGETDVTSEFDVTYSNNKNACEATADNAPTVTVTAKATSTSYTGSATKTFTIGRKALTLVANKVSIIEGEATPTSWTGSITGFVDGEGLGENDLCFFALDNPAASAVGSYAVTGMLSVNGSEAATNGNYGQNYTFANAADNATAFTINSYQPESSTTEVQNPDGTTTTTTTIISEYEGFTQKDVTVTVKDQNGKVLSQTTSSETTNPDGNIHRIEETVDANGNTTKVETVTNPVQLGGTATVTGSNGESTEFGVIKGGKDISISEITNQPIAIENGKEGAMTIEKTTKESFLANSTQNKFESTVTLRFRSSAFRAGMKITVLHQPDGSSTWEKITPDNVGDGECIVTFNSLARRHSATRGAKAARPFFRIDYSGANITCKAGDVELQAAEEAHGINRGDEQDIIIESGKTYDILTDKNLILTLQPSESDFLLTSFTMKAPDPNDLDGSGKVDAVDLVKAIAAGKTQAEIDEIVNAIMQK